MPRRTSYEPPTSPPQPAHQPKPDRFLTSAQVAAIEGVAVTPATVVDWIMTGLVVPDEADPKGVRKMRIRLPARKVGGRCKVKESDAIAFIDRITTASVPDEQVRRQEVTSARSRREAKAAKEAGLASLRR